MGVRSASSMMAAAPKPKVSSHMLKEAAKAAREAGGDAKDEEAMAAVLQYRKEQGLGKFQYAKGHMPPPVKAVVEQKAGMGMEKVASMGERSLAKQMMDEEERRAESILPEHNVEQKRIKSQSQIAQDENDSNVREANALMPEHNLARRQAAHLSREQIRNKDIQDNLKHANAVMPAHKKHVVQALKTLTRADRAKEEEKDNEDRADAIVPEHTPEKKARTQAQIRQSEEDSNEKHADAVVTEHNVEGAHQTRDEIRKQEEEYNAEHAAKVTPEHNVEGAHKTMAEIRKQEEEYNAEHAAKVVTESTKEKLRVSVAQQMAEEERQNAGEASSSVATDKDIDEAIHEAKAKESERAHAMDQDVKRQRANLDREAGVNFGSKKAKHAVSYSYDRLYQQALEKEERKSHAHHTYTSDETKLAKHLSSEVDNIIDGNAVHPDQFQEKEDLKLDNHLAKQVDEITAPEPVHLNHEEIHQEKVDQKLNQQLAKQVDAITAAADGPRDASHVMKSQHVVRSATEVIKTKASKALARKAVRSAAPHTAAPEVHTGLKGGRTAAMLEGERKLKMSRIPQIRDATQKRAAQVGITF